MIKAQKLTEKKVTALLYQKFRFDDSRGYFCLTQSSCGYSDIEDFIAFNKKHCKVIEVKLTKADFLNDFKTKQKYLDDFQSAGFNYFYFCVPEKLQEFCLKFLEKECPKAGLIVVNSYGLKAVKRARKVSNHKLSKIERKYFFKRMSSELANLAIKSYLK